MVAVGTSMPIAYIVRGVTYSAPTPSTTASRIRLAVASEATPDLLEGVARLLPQLSERAPVLGMRELERIISSPATQLLVAVDTEAVDMGRGRDDNRADSVSGTTAIVGMLTLIVCQIPTGTRAWIEDVVVDVKARRFGIATSLVQMALRLAQEAGAVTVELTSRPSRKAANLLYESIGFERRDTNVYRYRFEQALNIGHDESM